ncbi:protein associated with UVRAG as autophagy enhancer isoform X2 [Castor canadensis]|uniref:Protein associated with UVRAG as autophagy enhancer isoform X2 n=1 Tax=Castor canadensis TaxID=51338 RepID=A0AC58K3F8_CASCN
MVSPSMGRQDSPVVLWEGISHDSGDTEGSPIFLDTDHSPSQLDIRLRRNKAAWINSSCVQQPLQDLPSEVQDAGNHREVDAQLSSGNPLAEMPLSEDGVDSVSSASAQSSGEKSRGFLISTEEQVASPGHSQQLSLLTSPSPEVGSTCSEFFHLTTSADRGAVPRRPISSNSLSPETFVVPVDIEKENAHFHVADMIISAMEKMKWTILSQKQTESWSLEEASRSFGTDQAGSEVTFYPPTQQDLGSSTSSDSGSEGCAVLQGSPVTETSPYSKVVKEDCKCDFGDFVILELGELNEVTETCRCCYSPSKSVTHEPDFNSAEVLARELLQVFQKCWVLANVQLPGSLMAASSLVVNEEHIQKDFNSTTESIQEIPFKSRIRGAEDWVPPRFQIIFNVHPPLKRDLVVVAQNFFCAGCGTPIELKFVKRLRYCNYLGKYFCESCHSYAESCIPARILMMWDFRKYYVSNFSKQLLDSIWHQPIFNLLSISHSLYSKAKELDKVKDIQEQLFHIKKLLKTCRFAHSTMKAFEQLPRHLSDELYLFSLEDLVRTKKGLLAPLLKHVLKVSLMHVADCELCQGKGFICEFCQSTAVIFPFQTTTCRRCSACRACYHKQCFQSSGCPRCARIIARRRLLESLPSVAT